MLDALTIGSALVDIFITSTDFELQKTDNGVFLCQLYGAKIEVDSFQLCTGGGGGNVAVGLARAGLGTASIVELGKDFWSKVVMQDLTDDHVDTEYVIKERKESTGGSVILIGHDGGRTVMVHRGASAMLDPEDVSERAFARTKIVHVTSTGGNKFTMEKIFTLAGKYKNSLSWNPGSGELALLASGEIAAEQLPVQTLLCNLQEWQRIENIADVLIKKIPEILITDGKRGIEVIFHGKREHIEAAKDVTVVDETGAGDGFASGYLAGRFYGNDPVKSVQWGIKNSVSVIGEIGSKSGLLRYDELASS